MSSFYPSKSGAGDFFPLLLPVCLAASRSSYSIQRRITMQVYLRVMNILFLTVFLSGKEYILFDTTEDVYDIFIF